MMLMRVLMDMMMLVMMTNFEASTMYYNIQYNFLIYKVLQDSIAYYNLMGVFHFLFHYPYSHTISLYP